MCGALLAYDPRCGVFDFAYELRQWKAERKSCCAAPPRARREYIYAAAQNALRSPLTPPIYALHDSWHVRL